MEPPGDAQYVIPPYLINTCLGATLARELADIDEQLATNNVITPTLPLYYKPALAATTSFLNDPWLNEIIRIKIYTKVSAAGILGVSPPPLLEVTDSYLREMLATVNDDPAEEEEEDEFSDAQAFPHIPKAIPITAPATQQPGEVAALDDRIPPEYASYLRAPLFELMKKVEAPTSVPSVVSSSKKWFDCRLPLTWAPLIDAKKLEILKRDYGLQVAQEGGLATIKLQASTLGQSESDSLGTPASAYAPRPNLELMRRYYNFICDKEVSASTGVFYYEVAVDQTTTEAAQFKPVVLMNDSLVLCNLSLHMALGFTKRQFLVDGLGDVGASVDLNAVRLELTGRDRRRRPGQPADSLEQQLGFRPGEMRGLFAVNFQDATFYNLVKHADATQRQQAVTMNTRLSRSARGLEAGKIDLGVPFRTRLSLGELLAQVRVYLTDIVGCGINFITKLVFFTLNGVLARVITNEELTQGSTNADNLFGDRRTGQGVNLVFPILGFELGDGAALGDGDPKPSCTITTNFGFKEFRFNIDNYVQTLKAENQRFLGQMEKEQHAVYGAALGVSNPAESPARAPQLTMMNGINGTKENNGKTEANGDMPSSNDYALDELIKGYLAHQGYTDTIAAFAADTKGPLVTLMLTKLHASNRKLIKQYMTSNNFDGVLRFIRLHYPREFTLTRGKSIIFTIERLKLVWLVRELLAAKFGGSEFHFESVAAPSDVNEAFSYCAELRSENADNLGRLSTIEELAGLFVVGDAAQLKKHPGGLAMITNFDKDVKGCLDDINALILELLGYKRTLTLEMVFEHVSQNIKCLSLDYDDDKFMLVNFERDHMDF